MADADDPDKAAKPSKSLDAADIALLKTYVRGAPAAGVHLLRTRARARAPRLDHPPLRARAPPACRARGPTRRASRRSKTRWRRSLR